MIYDYYTYKSKQDFIAAINSYLKSGGWYNYINSGLRIKFENDGSFKVTKGLLYAWSIFYWFEGSIIDRERYTDVVLRFRLSLWLKAYIIFALLLPIIGALVNCIFIQQTLKSVGIVLAISFFTLFQACMIYLDKLRIKNSFAQSFSLIKGPF
jgi:hypothetical protein